MQAIRSKNTRPELTVRRILHKLGYRYRLHAPELPSKPDIVFRRRRKVVFVHGCFWHSHCDPNCRNARTPETNTGYWADKLAKTRERDKRAIEVLQDCAWEALILWECELLDHDRLSTRLIEFLG